MGDIYYDEKGLKEFAQTLQVDIETARSLYESSLALTGDKATQTKWGPGEYDPNAEKDDVSPTASGGSSASGDNAGMVIIPGEDQVEPDTPNATDGTPPGYEEPLDIADVREEEDLDDGWDAEQKDAESETPEELLNDFKNWTKKSISPFDGAAPELLEALQRAEHIQKGKNNGVLSESVPAYNRKIPGTGTPNKPLEYTSEEILNYTKGGRAPNNAWIIVGRDRSASPTSGYGGKGHTRAGAIDLVVGLQGHGPNHEMAVEKNFGSMNTGMPGDAARIYISQRADIDDYFGICRGFVGRSMTDSAIGIKADSVRIMANKGIKIVTGGGPQQKTSLYGDIGITYGIDLIAGNRDFPAAWSGDDVLEPTQMYLQPIPKGNNLAESLSKILDSLGSLNNIVKELALRQATINTVLCTNPYLGVGNWGALVVSSLNPAAIGAVQTNSVLINTGVIGALSIHEKRLGWINRTYLMPGASPVYINSRYNRTN